LDHPFLQTKNKRALVVYGTCSGNAELVANAIRDGLCETELDVEIERSEAIKAEIVKDYHLIVMVASTWNVGKLNDNFVNFDKEFKTMDLKDKKVAVVGLGDSENYDIFCGAADILEASVEKAGATKLGESLRIDGPPHGRLGEYKDWGRNLALSFLAENA